MSRLRYIGLTDAQWRVIMRACGDYLEGISDTGDPVQARECAFLAKSYSALLAGGGAAAARSRSRSKVKT